MRYMAKLVLFLSIGYGFLYAQAPNYNILANGYQEMMDKYKFTDSCMDASGKDTLYTWKAGLAENKEQSIKYLDIVIESKLIMINECPKQFFIDNNRDLKKELELIYEAKAHYEK